RSACHAGGTTTDRYHSVATALWGGRRPGMPEAFKPERQNNVHHVYQDSESLLVLDRHIQQRKQLGTVLLSRAAEKAGATVQWLNKLTCVASFNNTNLLILGYIHNQTR